MVLVVVVDDDDGGTELEEVAIVEDEEDDKEDEVEEEEEEEAIVGVLKGRLVETTSIGSSTTITKIMISMMCGVLWYHQQYLEVHSVFLLIVHKTIIFTRQTII